MILSASILSKEEKGTDILKRFNNTDINYIHVDVMDGKFVDNKAFPMSEIKKINDLSSKKLDVHLMVKNPEKYVMELAMLNTSCITFHYEAVKDINALIEYIKNFGLKVGIAINPDTNIEVLKPYLNNINQVLVMSVYPGKSGQAFIENTYNKVKELKELIVNQESKALISVDGGVNDTNASLLKESGVDILVSASFIQKDLENINYLIEL